MLETRAGSESEAAFLRLFLAGELVPVDITIADYERMAELVERYADWPLGGTDASVPPTRRGDTSDVPISRIRLPEVLRQTPESNKFSS